MKRRLHHIVYVLMGGPIIDMWADIVLGVTVARRGPECYRIEAGLTD